MIGLLRDVRTGRFERLLCGLTAAAALVNTAEIFLEHDRASFGNRMMWVPIGVHPVAAAAAVAGVASERAARSAIARSSGGRSAMAHLLASP